MVFDRWFPMALFALSCSCAPAPPPATPTANTTPTSTSTSTSTATATATATASANEGAGSRRPLDLFNACTKDVHLYFGEQPGDGRGEARTVSAGATIAVPRQPDDTATVWVVDDKGFGLASVHVTRRMKHVRIDPECMRIDADTRR
jgi:hypothetical protein